MNAREFILAKLNRFSLEVSSAEIDALLTAAGENPSSEYGPGNDRKVKLVLAEIIPELLLVPDVTEAGFSVKFDRQAVRVYYGKLCAELGIENQLENQQQPKITDLSNLW